MEKCALYARVSTADRKQNPQVQLAELRSYVQQRGWEGAQEFVDYQSGSRERRPGLDLLLSEIRRGRIKVILTVRLDRLGRSLKHLLSLLTEFQERNVALISLKEGLDFSTSSGRLLFSVIGAISQFERDLISERIKAGLTFARSQGKKLGRPKTDIDYDRIHRLREQEASIRAIAKELRLSPSLVHKILQRKLVRT